MILLHAYLLAALIFAIAMVVSMIKSDEFKHQDTTERSIGIIVVLLASFILYPLMIAVELELTDHYESKA